MSLAIIDDDIDPKPGDLLVAFISGELMTCLTVEPALPGEEFTFQNCKAVYPSGEVTLLSLRGIRRARMRYLQQYGA